MEDKVRDMTVRELADLLNDFVKHDMGDEPIRINGKAIRSIGYVQAKDGEVAHVNLKDTRPDISKMKKVTTKNYTCKITRIDPPAEKG